MHRIIICFAVLVFATMPVARSESTTYYTETTPDQYYMWTRDDVRMCATPLCGGFFVKALNHRKSICADGSRAADCYVFQLDFSALDMDEKEQAVFHQAFTDGIGIVKGKFVPIQQSGMVVANLEIIEAWLAQAGKNPDNHWFFQVHDTGIQCITTPCLTVEENLLNLQDGGRRIAGVDLSASGAGTEQVNAGYQEMRTGFVIATGRHKIVHGPAGFSQILVADEFYLPAAKGEPCGNTVCPTGQTCCNASCGICTPPEGACIQIACDQEDSRK